jgi:hypothetical protein
MGSGPTDLNLSGLAGSSWIPPPLSQTSSPCFQAKRSLFCSSERTTYEPQSDDWTKIIRSVPTPLAGDLVQGKHMILLWPMRQKGESAGASGIGFPL